MAVAMLYNRIKNPGDERRRILLEPKLNIRSSVEQITPLINISQFNDGKKYQEV